MNPNGGNENIKEFRCSLVWVSLLSKDSNLSNQKNYFDELNKSAANQGGWSLPWLANPRIFFWEYYLEKDSLLNAPSPQNPWVVDYRKAIRCIVPLRKKNGLGKVNLSAADKGRNEEVSSWIEGFAYPHGVGCIVTLRWRSQVGLALQDTVKRFIELRNTEFSWSISSPSKKQTLNDIGRDALNHLSLEIAGCELQDIPDNPFSVVTVVEAENTQLKSMPVEGGQFHLALDALCTKKPPLNWDWLNDAYPVALEKALLVTKRRHGVLYARGRGRVVWLPRYFREHCPPPQPRKPHQHRFTLYLGRYHRNLTLATMQTAYLSIFLKWVNDLRQQRNLTDDELQWERGAAGAIGRLFGKCKNSYLSESLPRQITLGNCINAINASRSGCGLPPLSDGGPPSPKSS